VNQNIHLVYNNGFKWHKSGNCHTKGYAFTDDGRFLRDKDLADYFIKTLHSKNSTPPEVFHSKITSLNGLFSVILQLNDTILAAVDPVRAFPIFYTESESGYLLSDSVDKLREITNKTELDSLASVEFLATGIVTGSETLTKGIFQVQSGEIIEFQLTAPPETKAHFYSSYRTRNTFNPGEEELLSHLDSVVKNMFVRLVQSLDNRTAVIALSGGYDSRFLVAKLKQLGYDKLICYSYGRQGNKDMEISGRVAAELGLAWIPIVYTEELIDGYLNDPNFYDYVKYSANHTSMFFMQEYFAVKHLKENNLIPDDSIIIPGHSADFFAGSMFIKHGLPPGPELIDTTVKRIFDVKYDVYPPSSIYKSQLKNRIKNSLEHKSTVDGAHPYSIHEDWDLKEKFSKFIVNSNNVYSFFGCEYRLPFYDREFHDFFRDLDFEMKKDKTLYDSYLVEGTFNEMSLNFRDEIQPSEIEQKRANLKRRIKKSIPKPLIPQNPPEKDDIYYNEITRKMKEALAKRGINIRIQGKTYNSLIIQWYLEFLKTK